MKKIKKLLTKIKSFTNYLYYFNSSIVRNSYPCKLVGEKIDLFKTGTYISYKILGLKGIKEIPLQNLLDDKNLIAGFHPVDAVKLGTMAFENIIFELEENERKEKFKNIKNIMLNSTHDICPNKKLEKVNFEYIYPNNLIDTPDYISSAIKENIYPCKLVGGKSDFTTIIYTILGKREGHEKLLQDLIRDKELLEKFHPTEAIKFGFISIGDAIFTSPIPNRKQQIKCIKDNMRTA